MNIAMWSGPRNLSTAMMYAFGARSDCSVWDEPYYAAFLSATGLHHPMRDAIIQAGESDPDKVAERLRRSAPGARAVFYQKHMTHHLIDGFDRGWFKDVQHVFLIRDPARVIASYAAKRQSPNLVDIGFQQQAEIFDVVCSQNGHPPPVIDSFDIRQSPALVLRGLCKRLGLEFQQQMLHWPKGGHVADGVWGDHWYGAVRASGGFAGAEGALPDLSANQRLVESMARPFYESMSAFAQRPAALGKTWPSA